METGRRGDGGTGRRGETETGKEGEEYDVSCAGVGEWLLREPIGELIVGESSGRSRATPPGRGHIESYRDLRVYRAAIDSAMRIFELTGAFPAEERYSMVDQIRRSSRSVCANIAEAWRKRRYKAHFISKLTDAESEAEETRVWLEFAWRCGYLSQPQVADLDAAYDGILAQLVRMISEPEKWTIR
jgi:four helix bundle protein